MELLNLSFTIRICHPLNIVLYFRFSSSGQLSVEERDIVVVFFPWILYPHTCLGNYTPCAGGHHPAIVVQSADKNSMSKVLIMTSSLKFPRTTYVKLNIFNMCRVFIMTSTKKFPGTTYVKLNLRSKLKKQDYIKNHKFKKYKSLKGNVLPTVCWVPCQYISKVGGVLGKVPQKTYKILTIASKY